MALLVNVKNVILKSELNGGKSEQTDTVGIHGYTNLIRHVSFDATQQD